MTGQLKSVEKQKDELLKRKKPNTALAVKLHSRGMGNCILDISQMAPGERDQQYYRKDKPKALMTFKSNCGLAETVTSPANGSTRERTKASLISSGWVPS